MSDFNIEEIFRLYYRPLCLYATHLLNDFDSVEDVVMDCYMKLWNRIKDNANIEDIKSYLYIAVRHECYDYNSKENSRIIQININSEKDDVELSQNEEQSEREARLWTAIDELPDKCKQVFLMSKRDEMTYAEIAEELNLSVKTIEAQITKAYKVLRGKAKDIYYFLLSLFA